MLLQTIDYLNSYNLEAKKNPWNNDTDPRQSFARKENLGKCSVFTVRGTQFNQFGKHHCDFGQILFYAWNWLNICLCTNFKPNLFSWPIKCVFYPWNLCLHIFFQHSTQIKHLTDNQSFLRTDKMSFIGVHDDAYLWSEWEKKPSKVLCFINVHVFWIDINEFTEKLSVLVFHWNSKPKWGPNDTLWIVWNQIQSKKKTYVSSCIWYRHFQFITVCTWKMSTKWNWNRCFFFYLDWYALAKKRYLKLIDKKYVT